LGVFLINPRALRAPINILLNQNRFKPYMAKYATIKKTTKAC